MALELATKQHKVLLAKVREEPLYGVKAWKVTKIRSAVTLAKVLKEMSFDLRNIPSERDSAAERHCEMVACNHRAVKARRERKDKAGDTLLRLRNIFDSVRMVTVEAHLLK